MVEKKINLNKIEKKWQKKWEEEKIFEVKENSKKKKFYVLDMFPYPSGEGLHIGHAFVFTLGDIFARFKRLQGFNVLYPIGYDSLGLPAENAAIKVGVHPKDYTKKSIANFMNQQKAMGWSYDWSRMVKSHDSSYYKWDQWIFLKMLEKKIAYRKKAPVNWCRKCNTVLANEQVHNGKCWRHDDTNVEVKHLEQWFLRISNYSEELLQGLEKLDWPERAKAMQRNWIGKSYGYNIDFKIGGKNWAIFTTRPDTLFGVTFMVVSAQHPRLMELVTSGQKKEVEKFLKKVKSTSEKDLKELEKEGAFTGSYAINPANGEKAPVWTGNFVVADYGCGMVMAVPAHDERDFQFAKKYNIPIKPVVLKNHSESFSYVMGVNEKAIKEFGGKIIEKTKDGFFKLKVPFDKLENYKEFIRKNLKPGFWNEFSTSKGFYFIFKHKTGKIEEFELDEKTNDIVDKYGMTFNDEKPNDTPENVYSWLAKNDFYKELLIHTGEGVLINSEKFNGLPSENAIEEIGKKFGKKTVNFKLRDWLVSRQRYWGTPIPVVYCSKCGIVPVAEKDLPVELPEKVKFGDGNPLESADDWKKVKCPKCDGQGRRETDTMDTFVNSSWYYLRYTDPRNSREIFDKKKANYWAPINQYIGGPEHITMHLIYTRFYTKFLRDIGLLRFDEPALRYFTQGIVKGSDGEKMSKSKGNVVEPLEMIKKYGADSLRLYLVSNSSPDSDSIWNENGIQSSFKFVNKVYNYFSNFKSGKIDARIESKLNKTIKEVTEDISGFKHNLAVIKIRSLFDRFCDEKIDLKSAESFLKMLHVYCPFITEDLWMQIGGKGFISLASWPAVDEKKIDEKLEKAEQAAAKTVSDVLNILKIVMARGGAGKKIYIYVLPSETGFYNSAELTKKIGKEVWVFAVNDKSKYDPKGFAGKTKPGRPAIFVE